MTLKSLLGSAAVIALTSFAFAANAAGSAASDASTAPAGVQSTAGESTPGQSTTNQGTAGTSDQGTASPSDQGTTGQSTMSKGSNSSAEVSLSQVSNPQETLAKASVQDSQGNSIGPVQTVVVGSNGKPTAVKVDVGSFLGTASKVVAIKASKLKFQQDNNILVTTMTKDQIKSLPQAKGI